MTDQRTTAALPNGSPWAGPEMADVDAARDNYTRREWRDARSRLHDYEVWRAHRRGLYEGIAVLGGAFLIVLLLWETMR